MQEDEINEYNAVDENYDDGDYKVQVYEQQDAISKPGISYSGRVQQTQRFMPLTQIYSEDMRISRILRRLMGEQQPAQALEICEKLESAVRSPSNAAYICRSFEMLLDNLTQILRQCPIEIVQQVSNILGLIGYINRTNFPIYKNFITKTYQNSKSLRKYLMSALKMTFRCDAVNLDLIVYSKRVLDVLIDYLENAEKADIFISISDTISEFAKHYGIAFAEKFTDIVDIVVGWHLETDQAQSLKLHCSLVLQRWAAYFLNELDFTYGLLGQFLEDINAWLDDLNTEGATKKARYKAELRIAAFIGAFTTILKSLVTPTDFVGLTADVNFVENAVFTILKAAKEVFTSKDYGEEITMNVNDFLSLLLTYNYKFINIADVDELIQLQLEHIGYYNEQQTGGLLYVIICYLRHQRTALSCNFLTRLLNAEMHSEFSALKLTKNESNYKLYLKIYHEILLLKNVPLLQEAYKHIKADIHNSMESLQKFQEANKGNDNRNFENAVQKINFYLNALAVLATQTSSIISMYALDPSILELLIQNCKAADVIMWNNTEPCLHNALLKLLALHCQRNNNFVNTSRLLHDQPSPAQSKQPQVLEEQIRNSPTSEHFTHILKFFDAALKQANKLNMENLNLLLGWLEQLIETCKPQMNALCENSCFLSICQSLCATAIYLPLESAKCMQQLAIYMPSKIFLGIKATALFMLNANDHAIQATYAEILGILPLSVTLKTIECDNNEHAGNIQLNKINELKKWYQGTQKNSPLRAKYFKEFLEYFELPFLKQNSSSSSGGEFKNKRNSLENIFVKCFIDQADDEQAAQYQNFGRRHNSLIAAWLQCEAARYCVRNKLRTTVGKPQETFLAIEAIVIKYARLLSSKPTQEEITPQQNAKKTIAIAHATEFQHRAHLLLGFLESLEKQIYNAAHGTAFAMPSAEKPAKTFFRINASTCNEWFKRIRPGVCLIAAHCMEPEMAVRYTEQTLTKVEQLSSPLLESTLINLVEALLTHNEADSLIGLHAWIRNKTGKSYAWIQCAAVQASGHFEQAGNHYKALIDENHIRLDSQIKQFVLDQLFYCLYFTGQWKEMKDLIKQLGDQSKQNITFNLLNNTKSITHLDTMQALCFGPEPHAAVKERESSEVLINDAMLQLMDWSTVVDNKNGLNASTQMLPNYSSYNILQSLEDTCIVEALKVEQVAHAVPSEIQNALQACLHELMACSNSGGLNVVGGSADYLLLNHFVRKIFTNTATIETADFVDLMNLFNENVNETTVLFKSTLWSLLVQHRGFGLNGAHIEKETTKSRLYLDMAAKARDDGNLSYSRRMLSRFFAFKGFTEPLVDISKKLIQREQVFDISDPELLRAISELSKSTYLTANSNQTNASQYEAINLASVLCLQIVEQAEEKTLEDKVYQPTIGAQTLHCLADWLGHNNPNNTANSVQLQNLPQLLELLDKLPEPLLELSDRKLDDSVPAMDKAVGKLYNASTWQKADVADAWLAYGNWCYRWGKKLVELKNSENQALSNKNSENELSERDVAELGNILKQNFSQELLSDISKVLQRHQFSSKIDAADDDLDANFTGSALELIEQELRQIDELRHLSSDEIMDIIRIWRRTHKTVYAYYESAIRAYLRYLSLETSSNSEVKSKDDDCGFVTTTLRILRLVVKHAFALQEVLEASLNATPLRPWKVIIPQLFSRLNHHEPYVRSSLAQLLCRLAQDEPHAVIFPAVVGSQQENLQKEKQNCVGGGDESGFAKASTTNTELSNCFSSLVSKLSEQSPQTVRHVQLLVRELRRVALLGEEYWLHTLGRLLTEYSSLFSSLVMEFRKCNRSNVAQMDKMKIKHELLLQYVVTDLQKIIAHTDKPAETKYEQSFKAHYETHIQQTLKKLSEPEIIDIGGPVESWQLLKNLYQRFQQRSMHGLSTASSTLKISDLSYTLGNMRDTAISMPGVAPKQSAPIYIKAIENTVHILPTKTRPKKLVFLGSDGQKYTYLFKGLEDLHLDERVMQFLSISNLMMQRTRDRKHTQAFRAHYYSVIPLGPQSGLISWVDGVTPLFAIYKKWQQRDAVLKQQQNKEQQQQQESPSASQLTALRPSELFYKKLRPLLTAQNIKLKDSRKQWPLSILRRVLDELIEETPSDLLSKELWCHATSAAEWHSAVRCYTTSTAVMSVIGYIIGLGDRHLDNVLINLHTGEIVHIDYNVCFEKGKTLRVPEKVPFRMTPNFENALGVTGVEGAFRLGCEYVLKTLRKEKETLLTLLEAFVYDPLVDWTVSDEGIGGGTTRSALAYAAMQSVTSIKPGSSANLSINTLTRESPMRVNKQFEIVQRKKEWEIMQQTIKTRFEDIRSHWAEYVDEIEQSLQKIENVKEQLKSNLKSMNQIEDERNKLNQQVAIIREMEMLGTAIGSHSLNTITQRFQAYKQDAETLATLRKSAEIAQKDIENLLSSYFGVVIGDDDNEVDGSELTILQNELLQYENNIYTNEFEAMRAYIEQISAKTYEDVSFARKEMDNSLQQEARTAMECIKLLMQYSHIMNFYPRKKLCAKNGLFRYAEWYRQLWLEGADLSSLKAEVEYCRKNENELQKVSKQDKMKIAQYAGLLEKTLYEINMKSHQILTVEENLRQQQQQQSTVENIIQEIRDFAALDEKTRTTLQAAMLQVLTETLRQLDAEENSQNLLKEIDFIQIIAQIFEQLDLVPKSVQQLSEQKMLKQLENTLKALNDLEQDFGFEFIVELFFKDNDNELQNELMELCKVNANNLHDIPSNAKLNTLLTFLNNKFEAIETEILQLQQIVQEILEVDTCSWFNILLERLCVVRSLKPADLLQWKSQTISELFSLARDIVESLRINRTEMIYDARLLYSSIKASVGQFYSNYLKGLTLALTEAYINSFQIKINYAESNTAARLLCNKLLTVLHNNFELSQLQMQVIKNNKISENFTYVASAYVWLNHTLLEDMLPNLTHIIPKESLLTILGSLNQSMSAWKHTITKIQDDISQHTQVLQQRLRWTVAGAVESEDAANKLMSCYEDNSAMQTTRYSFFLQLAVKLIENINVLLQFETLMNDSITAVNTRRKAEASFLLLIEEWQQIRNRYAQSSALITPVEKSIVELLDPEDKVDACWIANITGLLEELIFGVQKNLSSLEEASRNIQHRLYEYANDLQTLTDNPLRTDMRQLLRLIIKNARYPPKNTGASSSPNPADETFLTSSARELLQLLKSLFGKLGELKTKLYLRENYDNEAVEQLDEKLKDVRNALNQQHKELNAIIQNYLEQSNYNTRSNSASPARMASPAGERRDETTIEKKGEQKRNAYAVSVWKRIRMKLEGRDPDANRRSSVAEQIDFIINEATNRDNLAVLYEGWTPWV